MSSIESANSDYKFWSRKYEKVSSAYHRDMMLAARDRLQRLQWDQERKTGYQWRN